VVFVAEATENVSPPTKSGGHEWARTDQDDAHRYVLTRSSVLSKTILPVCADAASAGVIPRLEDALTRGLRDELPSSGLTRPPVTIAPRLRLMDEEEMS